MAEDEFPEAAVPAAWAFLGAVEHVPMDDQHEDLAAALVAEFSEDAVMRGLAVVAGIIRDQLRDHADQLGCTCGSDEWFDQMTLLHAQEVGE